MKSSSTLFSNTYEKLWKNINENDFLPIGQVESHTIYRHNKSAPYPHVVEMNQTISVDKLLEDWTHSLPHLQKKTTNLLEDYNSYYINTDKEEVVQMMNELGFSLDSYKIYPLREPGNVELLPLVGEYTRKCMDDLGRHFRQLYTVAQPGWCSKPHIDNKNMEQHGFKIQLPVNIDSYFGYVCPDGVKVYKLSKGKAHFCDTSVPHFGINPLKEERLALNFQISSDRDVLSGKKIQAVKEPEFIYKQIPWYEELYKDYERHYSRLLSPS